MKTYKNLYPQIYAFENLEQAFRKARRGKRHKPNVAAFEFNLDLELLQLQDELQAETYRPGGYRHFTIYDGKPRRISAAPFRDRVVHHALCNVTEPIWDEAPDRARFIRDSYACRVGKGTHAALDRCTQFSGATPTSYNATSCSSSPRWTTPCCGDCWPGTSPVAAPCGWST